MAQQRHRRPPAKIYVVLLADHPEVGIQAAFTTASRARAFAARSGLRAYVDAVELHVHNCCEPIPLVTVSAP